METSLSGRARLSLFFQYKYLRILIKVVLATERRGRKVHGLRVQRKCHLTSLLKNLFIHSFPGNIVRD